jgi:hypothetical protein
MEKWTKSKKEWVGQAGWSLLATLAREDDDLPDTYFEAYLSAIERGIHSSRNRVRYAMNGALIAIGMRNARLEKKAIAVAKRIGEVEVDHGETGCQTPDAVAYLQRGRSRKRRR